MCSDCVCVNKNFSCPSILKLKAKKCEIMKVVGTILLETQNINPCTKHLSEHSIM
jgi:hypothetical protein